MCCKKVINCIFVIVGLIIFCIPTAHYLHNDLSTQYLKQDVIYTILLAPDSSYDTRDTFNQKITNPSVENSLKSLFVFGLYKLLLDSEIYSIAKAIQLLNQKLNLAATYIARTIQSVYKQIVTGIISQLKRLTNLTLLFALFFAIIIVNSFLFHSYLFFTPKAKVAPLVLRC